MKATTPRSVRKEEIPKTYPRGRVCSREGCDTVLSIYTHGRRCAIHDPALQRISEKQREHELRDLAVLMEEEAA